VGDLPLVDGPGVAPAAALVEVQAVLPEHGVADLGREDAEVADPEDVHLAQEGARGGADAGEVADGAVGEERVLLPPRHEGEAVGLDRLAGEAGDHAVGADADRDLEAGLLEDLALQLAADAEGWPRSVGPREVAVGDVEVGLHAGASGGRSPRPPRRSRSRCAGCRRGTRRGGRGAGPGGAASPPAGRSGAPRTSRTR
jgi:hypothetical protein